ncbi:hypothetical protein BC936DRAFT_149781 [Jimgerdemannia flammicorona]|uniref:Uncharacterized protein n=2 Tax=Jimgerdemannia flammicorona TaxID=994334 RepID=A0A433D059_9FUNG|nr:hypothetical protein BC936DRAFT_149781 [Jimgerdemannia flammicorona]RUS33780.1 hypothetical protein BC938DRAFT_483957 [Jimgerdemannia flammicorona]
MSSSATHPKGKTLIERIPSKTKKDVDDIPDAEKWRIVEESGLLKKVKTKRKKAKKEESEPEIWEYVFQALFISVPFSFLFSMFDVVVRVQYRESWTVPGLAWKTLQAFPVLFVIIYLTNRHKPTKFLQLLMVLASTGCGCFLLYTSTKSSSLGQMQRTPGLATIWIYLIVQLDLVPALISLSIALLYYYYGLSEGGSEPIKRY